MILPPPPPTITDHFDFEACTNSLFLTSSFDRTNLALKLDGEETKFVQIGPRNIKLLILPLSLPTFSYKYNLIVVKFLLAQIGCFEILSWDKGNNITIFSSIR